MENLNYPIYNVGSLFAGIGGIDIAFQNAGFKIKWANEIDKKACDTYTKNLPHKIICEDIQNLQSHQLAKIDILTGGFPCQAFSIAGLQKGFEDKRGSLIFEVLRLTKELNPKVLFLENVKNLKSHHKGETFRQILNAIENIGYKIKYDILNTCEYSSIPQNRERVYIVAFKKENEYEKFKFPQKSKQRLSIKEFLEKKVAENYYYTNHKYYPQLREGMLKETTCYQWRRHYVRENKNDLCPTLTANMGTGGHNVPLVLDKGDIRKLTPRECARFQGFADNFILPDVANSVLYKQIGNSISIPVVEAIAKEILKVLHN